MPVVTDGTGVEGVIARMAKGEGEKLKIDWQWPRVKEPKNVKNFRYRLVDEQSKINR